MAAGGRRRSWPRGRLHRIEDRPEHHEAPGAWAWDPGARQRRDASATHAARRFLEGGHPAEDCWRCEAALAAGPLALCPACLEELQQE